MRIMVITRSIAQAVVTLAPIVLVGFLDFSAWWFALYGIFLTFDLDILKKQIDKENQLF